MKRVRMLPLLVGLLVCSALLLTTCGFEEAMKKLAAKTSDPGVYVGVYSYDGSKDPKDLVKSQQDNVSVSAGSNSLAYLSDDNNSLIQQYVLNDYKQGNTSARALMCAVSKVIDNLKNDEKGLNGKLNNVTIVSFSSGEDQGSPDYAGITGVNNPLVTYGNQIRTKINTTIINTDGNRGIPINAYSVILSPTANPSDDIKNTAQYITSGDGAWGQNPYIITASDLTENTLKPIFEGIAGSLPGIKYASSVTIAITGPGSINTATLDSESCNFAAVFNDKAPDATDVVSIKGLVSQGTDGKYQMANIKYTGIPSGTAASVVESERNGIKVGFTFPGLELTIDKAKYKQYKYDGSSWNELSGVDAATDLTALPAEKKTAVVVLILDASLRQPTDINNVRAAAAAFINKLYTESKQK